MTAAADDAVFAALAHGVRRRVLDILLASPGASVNQVAAYFPHISRVAVLKHVRVLEAAGLVLSEKRGRVRHLYFNAVPIQLIHERWTDRYGELFAGRMIDVKARVEASTRRKARKHA